jgi:hypothetical protein
MERRVTVPAALAVVLFAPAYIWYCAARPEELPEPRGSVLKEVFPDADYRAAEPGSSVARVYAAFGKTPPNGAAHRRCVLFRYDPLLFEGALAVLTNDNVIERRWVTKSKEIPAECAGVPHESVDLAGWYAAAVRTR